MTVICLPDDEAAALTGPLPEGCELVLWTGGDPAPAAAARIGFMVPAYMSGPPDGFFDALPELRAVQLVSAGADRWVDHVPAHVALCDARGVHGGSTSEWVLSAILAVLREVPAFVRAQDRHEWAHRTTDELAGKRVLVVGAGDLGSQARRRLEACDATVTMAARRARDGVHGFAEISGLLPGADIVVVVVPLTPQTTGLVDAAFLRAMPDGALLVNAARGPVVDTAALLPELRSGRLRAALDVTDPEPLPEDHELWGLPTVYLTPHVGGDVAGFPRRAYRLVAGQIARFARGEQLHNVVSDGY